MQQGSSFFNFDFGKFKSSCQKVIRFVEGIKNRLIGHFSQINPEVLKDEYVVAVTEALRSGGIRINTPRMQKILHGFEVKKDTSTGFFDKRFTITNRYYKTKEEFKFQNQTIKIASIMNMLDHGRVRGFVIPRGASKGRILVWKYGSSNPIMWNCKLRGKIKSPTKKAISGVLRNGTGWMKAGEQRLSQLIEQKRIKIKNLMK